MLETICGMDGAHVAIINNAFTMIWADYTPRGANKDEVVLDVFSLRIEVERQYNKTEIISKRLYIYFAKEVSAIQIDPLEGTRKQVQYMHSLLYLDFHK